MRKPDYNRHVMDLFRRFVRMPIAATRWVCQRVLRLCSTADSRRADDSLRQSRARRELRGLTPDHDPAAPHRGQ